MTIKKIEIAYRLPGEPWRRKAVTARYLESTVLKLEDQGAEILTRFENDGKARHDRRHLCPQIH